MAGAKGTAMKRRVAMITGGNRGLGQAVAAELHTRGLAVVVWVVGCGELLVLEKLKG